MQDPYTILGVSKPASADEIRKAYRKLAKQNHPDLHPGDKGAEERFKRISAAYDLLSDPHKGRRYDAGEINAEGQETPRSGYYRDFAQGPDANKYDRSLSDDELAALGGIFSEIFGARAGQRGAAGFGGYPGDGMVSIAIRVPFLLAARGGRQRVTLPDGKIIEIEIPEGAEDRQMLRLKGQGLQDSDGGTRGDAYIELHVQPHAFFERRDNNVHMELPVTLVEAVLGGRVNVPTVGGPVKVTIPPGSNTGTTLRLKGRGILDRRSGTRGDQYVKLRVVLPDKPDDKLKAFLETWETGGTYDPRQHLEQLS